MKLLGTGLINSERQADSLKKCLEFYSWRNLDSRIFLDTRLKTCVAKWSGGVSFGTKSPKPIVESDISEK